MSRVIAPTRLRFGQHYRDDNWWLQPVAVALGLTIGFGYLTVSMFLPNYWHVPYLSPVGSPPNLRRFTLQLVRSAMIISCDAGNRMRGWR